MIVRSGGRNVVIGGEKRSYMPNGFLGSQVTTTGRVTDESLVALPAVMAATRIIAETVAMLPLELYSNGRQVSNWQSRMLGQKPNDVYSAFDLWSYVLTCLQLRGNAYLYKMGSPRVLQLWPLNPASVKASLTDDYRMVYKVRTSKGLIELGSNDILHIRGVMLPSHYEGVSLIELHRTELSTNRRQYNFNSQLYENGAIPGGTIKLQPGVSGKQKDAVLKAWNESHQGRPGKIAVLSDGSEFTPIGLTLQDSQYIETARFNVEEVARMFRLPSNMLGVETSQSYTPEQENLRFLQLSLQPWLRRIEFALENDSTLFPGKNFEIKFDVDELLRADIKTRHEAYLKGKQAGWMTANEIREAEGMEPLPGGDELQLTPVGGAPNPNKAYNDTPSNDTVQVGAS